MGKPRVYALILLLIALPALGAPKTDVIIFKNGDRLTGEVKSLERGRLRFNTDATGTISIEWDDIASLTSDQNIQVETEEGRRYLGRLTPTGSAGVTAVQSESGPIELESGVVILMAPIEEKGVSRLDGDITAGYNFAKASEIKQLHFGLDMDYRTETRILSLQVDATTSDSSDSESSQRESVDLSYRRLLPNRWIAGGVLSLNRNDELGLDLRTSVGAGGGRILKQTNTMNLSLEGGLLYSSENVASGLPSEETWEAFTTLRWGWFRYDTPELDLSTQLQLIPNLTDSGRLRGEFDISLKWELVEDLFWELSFYDSYDSKPVVPGAEKNDFGVNTSLGWDF
jgi:hypothetical protein